MPLFVMTLATILAAQPAAAEPALPSSLDLEEILIELVTRTQDAMQMDAAMILLEDESGDYLELRTAAGSVHRLCSSQAISMRSPTASRISCAARLPRSATSSAVGLGS